MMGDLYGIATSAIVFLGGNDDSDLAIGFAEKSHQLTPKPPDRLPRSHFGFRWAEPTPAT